MKTDSDMLEIVEDHVRIVDFIDHIVCAIENGTAMPNFVPVLHDLLVTDQLGRIAEAITSLRGSGEKSVGTDV